MIYNIHLYTIDISKWKSNCICNLSVSKCVYVCVVVCATGTRRLASFALSHRLNAVSSYGSVNLTQLRHVLSHYCCPLHY